VSKYIEQCLAEYIKGMEYREQELREQIAIKNAELKLLEKERLNLSIGLDNWQDEEKQL
jgi:hypothetical protein